MSIADSSHEKFDGFDRGLDQICDEFERVWKSSPNSPPVIADYLARAPKHAMVDLIYELVGIDLEFRWRDPVTQQTVDEYLRAWPELTTDQRRLAEIRQLEAELDAERDDAGDLEQLFGPSSDDQSSTHAKSLSTWAAGDQFHQFTLQEKLGAGSFGEVWKAKDAQLDRIVAIKFSQAKISSTESSNRLHSGSEGSGQITAPKYCSHPPD